MEHKSGLRSYPVVGYLNYLIHVLVCAVLPGNCSTWYRSRNNKCEVFKVTVDATQDSKTLIPAWKKHVCDNFYMTYNCFLNYDFEESFVF